jgi:hypothetical protein
MHMISIIHGLKLATGKEAQLYFKIQQTYERCENGQSVCKLIFRPQKNNQIVQTICVSSELCTLQCTLTLKNFKQKSKCKV